MRVSASNRRTASALAGICLVVAALVVLAASIQGQQAAGQAAAKQTGDQHPLGFDDTPILPGQKWHVHDFNRPRPRVITPGARYGEPPSDAVVLFDGKDLSKWAQWGRGANRGKMVDAQWKVENGFMEIAPETGDLFTREKFGDAQYHVEWASPTQLTGVSQERGNSGFLIMSRYEIQVLDCYDNPTYADGGAGAIYGQWPPLVNPARKPGEWQSYDIVFEAPRFENEKLVKPAYATVFYNGVVVQNHQQIIGRMAYRQVGTYAPHGPEEPLLLQDHHNKVRFRNIWVRRLRPVDEP